MKLLIVDDQVGVVTGLKRGINWTALGFDQVDCAYNALDARLSLENAVADVMLCDIEMPMQNGLDLLAWMREQGMETRCIFLTAHARFDYARDALKLGGFDYIMQPAPYAEIQKAVEKAVLDVKANRAQDELQELGTAFHHQRFTIAAEAAARFLLGQAGESDYALYTRTGLLPALELPAYLIIFRPLRWIDSLPWEGGLLATALDNIVREIFESYRATTILAHVPQDNCFAILVQAGGEEQPAPDEMERQLRYLESVCRQYMNCTTACRISGPVPVREMPGLWPQLRKAKEENVALQSGVFWLSDQPRPARVFRVPQIKSWSTLLSSGFPEAMEREADELLDQLSQRGQLDSATLNAFYHDFFQMLSHAAEGNQDLLQFMFQEPQALELYRNGMRSIDDMKMLIHHVATKYQGEKPLDNQREIVEKVCQYIGDNLVNELRRDELADHVHLNPDYLTRIFKKETGKTIKEYVIEKKMEEARRLLQKTNLPVNIIASKVGYYNFSHFSASYRRVLGVSPQEERGKS